MPRQSPHWLRRWGIRNPRIRLGAAEVLGRIGLPATRAADRLITLRAGDPDPEVRRYAALALAGLRPGDPASIDALAEAIRDKHQHADSRVHQAAQQIADDLGRSGKKEATTELIEVLARLCAGATIQKRPGLHGEEDNSLGCMVVQRALEQVSPDTLPILIQALGRKDVQDSLPGVFQKIGAPAVPGLIAALKSDDPVRRASAASAFQSIAFSEENREHTLPAVPVLTDLLNDKDSHVRAAAASALGEINMLGAKATGLLIQQLTDADKQAAIRAGLAVKKAKVDAGTAIPGLIALFRRPEREIREWAMEALAKIGPTAVPALLKLLKEGDREGRVGAIESLRKMEVDHDSLEAIVGDVAVPLAEALKDEDRWVRHCAGYTLYCLHEKAAPALPTLIALLDHERNATRVEAIGVLGILDPRAVPALVRALGDADPLIRAAAASSLGGSLSPGAGAIEPLLHALKDKDARVRASAAESLSGAMVASSGRAVDPEFIEELFPDFDLSPAALSAARVATEIAFSAVVGRPATKMFRLLTGESVDSAWEAPLREGLISALSDPEALVRRNAVRSLGSLVAGAEAVIDPLLKRLGDSDLDVRTAAAEAISKMGPSAVPRLARLLTDGDANVRAAAAVSLGQMQPGAIRPATRCPGQVSGRSGCGRTHANHPSSGGSSPGRCGNLRFAGAPHDRSPSERIETVRRESAACRFAGPRVDRSPG